MIFTLKQKQIAFKNLPEDVQNFIMDFDTTDLIDSFLAELNLNDDQKNQTDTEIMCAMYGLQTLSEAIISIGKITGKNSLTLNLLKDRLQDKVFSEIQKNNYTNTTDWKVKVIEISEKYGLSNTQSAELENICKEALTDVTTKSKVLDNLSQRLGVSQILSDQIIDDLEKRIFVVVQKVAEPEVKRALNVDEKLEKMEEKRDEKRIDNVLPSVAYKPIERAEEQTSVPQNQPADRTPGQTLTQTGPQPIGSLRSRIPKMIFPGGKDQMNVSGNVTVGVPVPERISIPSYVPTKAEDLKAEEVKKYENLKVDTLSQMRGTAEPAQVSSQLNNADLERKITYKPVGTGEVVQSTTNIPRINLNQDSVSAIMPETPVNSTNETIIQEASKTAPAPSTSVETQSPIAKSYSVDPYRESIQ